MMQNEKTKWRKEKDKIIEIAFSEGSTRSVDKYLFPVYTSSEGKVLALSQTSEAKSLRTQSSSADSVSEEEF